jgi:hypothetical protein
MIVAPSPLLLSIYPDDFLALQTPSNERKCTGVKKMVKDEKEIARGACARSGRSST